MGPTDARAENARALCEQLLAEFFQPGQLETKQRNERLVQIAFAWANQVYRFVRAALVLSDAGHGHEALVLHRQALEFTVRLHWLVQLGDAGVDAVLADHKQSMTTLAVDAEGGPLGLPQEYLDTLGEVEVDETYTYVKFTEACDVLGLRRSLYSLYRHISAFVHPTFSAANVYLQPHGANEPVEIVSEPPSDLAEPVLLAQLLIWSARSLDDLINGKPRRRRLQQAARALGAAPVLPYLQRPARKKAQPKRR